MDLSLTQLREIFNTPNKQYFKINTYKEGKCTKCKKDCKELHYTLEDQYVELGTVIKNIQKYNNSIRCHNHENDTYHNKFNCQKSKCQKCGKVGHEKQVCNNVLYFWNRLYLCGC